MIVQDILKRVAAETDVSVEEMRGPSSIRTIAHARQRAMYEIRQLLGEDGKPRFSQAWVGNYFGGRDHTTVAHAERAYKRRCGL